MAETVRVSGIEVAIEGSKVFFEDRLLGTIGREERLGQMFWRAYDPTTGEVYKRFFTARHEAIRLLLINADLLDGLGF